MERLKQIEQIVMKIINADPSSQEALCELELPAIDVFIVLCTMFMHYVLRVKCCHDKFFIIALSFSYNPVLTFFSSTSVKKIIKHTSTQYCGVCGDCCFMHIYVNELNTGDCPF